MPRRLGGAALETLVLVALATTLACTGYQASAPLLDTPTAIQTPARTSAQTRAATSTLVTARVLARVTATPAATATIAPLLSPTPNATPAPARLPINTPTTPSASTPTAMPDDTSAGDPRCTNRIDDYQIQWDQVSTYVQEKGLPPAVMQVDLESHRKVSQYLPEITSAYGFNACGLVAAAAALGGDSWLTLAAEIRTASGDAYGAGTGIQPSPYVYALQRVFGAGAVAEENEWTLCALHRALHEGAVVIVNIQVGSTLNERREQPTTQAPNYAHFARVLGVDLEAEMIYIEDTLGGKTAYWPLALPEFWEAWKHPETAVSVRAPNPEDVTRWAVIIQPQAASMAGERNGGKPYG